MASLETIIVATAWGVIIAYVLIRLTRLEAELKGLKDRQRMAQLEQTTREAEVQGRLGGMEGQVHVLNGKFEKVAALLEENIQILREIVLNHQNKLEQLEKYWLDFWQMYEIKKK